MPKPVRNIGASVRARLLNVAQSRNQPFELVLTRFVNERLLYRLSQSEHRSRFVLKGAFLLTTWLRDPHRATRDLDFLGFGDPAPAAVLETFRQICAKPIDDGVQFDLKALRIDRIREELEYGGLRVRTMAVVGGARVHVIVDIGFGDSVEPGLDDIELPVLLDMPAPRLRAYTPETVVAEKFQAMVALGLANSRMKDFDDLWILSRTQTFSEDRLARAIAATFRRRDTPIPASAPEALTPAFSEDPTKRQQWAAFVRNVSIQPPALDVVIADLAAFLMPWAERARALADSNRGADREKP
jgi:predicted nucleotidyltransferase component of viral defense system